MSAKSKHTLQASSQLTEVLKIENAEAEDDDKLRIHVLPHDRPLFHALFAHLLLEQHEAAVVKAP